MDKKSDDHLIIMRVIINSNRQDYDENMKNITSPLTEMITSMMDQIKISKSSPYKRDSPKYQYHTTVVLFKNKAPPLEGGHSIKIGGMWNLKHDIRSPKLYEFLINT